MRASGPSEPYYPLLDLLTRLARSADDDTVATILSRHAPSWLPHLPALSEEAAGAFAAGTHVSTAARMLREVVTALEALAEETTLVVWIEDLQWADAATMDVLTSLGQRRDPAKILLLATVRPVEPVAASAPLRRAQFDLLARANATELRLQALALEDVTQYLDRQLGSVVSGQSSLLLHRLTNGNPLFLLTAIDHLVRKGLIRESGDGWRVEAPLDALEAAVPASLVGTVVRASSTSWRPMNVRPSTPRASWASSSRSGSRRARPTSTSLRLNRCSRYSPVAAPSSSAKASSRWPTGVFSPLYRFTHGLYQEIVLEQMATRPRADAHARAGLAMERVFSGREHEAAADLACHFHGAGDHLRAARYLRLAAGNALKRYAPREAAALLHGASTHALAPDVRPNAPTPSIH